VPDRVTVQNSIGAMFMMTMTQFMGNTFPNLLVFQTERPVFMREQINQMYDVFPYYLTKVMLEMPVMLITPILMLALTYFGVNFRRDPDSFFMFYLALEGVVQCGSSMGLMISSFAPNLTTA